MRPKGGYLMDALFNLNYENRGSDSHATSIEKVLWVV